MTSILILQSGPEISGTSDEQKSTKHYELIEVFEKLHFWLINILPPPVFSSLNVGISKDARTDRLMTC